jgi:hypothetical protein
VTKWSQDRGDTWLAACGLANALCWHSPLGTVCVMGGGGEVHLPPLPVRRQSQTPSAALLQPNAARLAHASAAMAMQPTGTCLCCCCCRCCWWWSDIVLLPCLSLPEPLLFFGTRLHLIRPQPPPCLLAPCPTPTCTCPTHPVLLCPNPPTHPPWVHTYIYITYIHIHASPGCSTPAGCQLHSG